MMAETEATDATLHAADWCVARTQPRRESRAFAELLNQNFDVFLPLYRRQIRHARRVTDVERPLFPGYLFVRDRTKNRWRSINGTLGIIGLVMMGDKPAAVAPGVVENLFASRDADGYIPLPSRPVLQRGDPIRVLGGTFAEALGLFEEFKDHDRVMILLTLLGRKVRVSVDEWLVDKPT